MRISEKVFSGELIHASMASPIGTLDLLVSPVGLRAVLMEKDLEDERCARLLATFRKGESDVLAQATAQLKEYFTGQRQEFFLPLDLVGTPFQVKVWNSLLRIGFGDTKTYSWQAKLIKNPQAVRAVGTANGCNPVSIVVPCHRVIRKDNDLAGYGGGLEVKRALLKMEDRNKRIMASVV